MISVLFFESWSSGNLLLRSEKESFASTEAHPVWIPIIPSSLGFVVIRHAITSTLPPHEFGWLHPWPIPSACQEQDLFLHTARSFMKRNTYKDWEEVKPLPFEAVFLLMTASKRKPEIRRTGNEWEEVWDTENHSGYCRLTLKAATCCYILDSRAPQTQSIICHIQTRFMTLCTALGRSKWLQIQMRTQAQIWYKLERENRKYPKDTGTQPGEKKHKINDWNLYRTLQG